MFKFFILIFAIVGGAMLITHDDNAPPRSASKGLTLEDIQGPVSSSSLAQGESADKSRSRAVVLRNLDVEVIRWVRGGFDTVMVADFKITNNNEFDVKDVVIKCEHFAASGTRIDSSTRTLYEVFSANKGRIVKEFNMGRMHSQAQTSGCSVAGFLFAS